MELHATGWNAWGQLYFNSFRDDGNVDDIHAFTCVLKKEVIHSVEPQFSYTEGDSSSLA
jgi:hypothetical protein